MGNKVCFTVMSGPMKGKTFDFEEHDTFLFGRLEECHCRLPDDGQVSKLFELHTSYRKSSIRASSG